MNPLSSLKYTQEAPTYAQTAPCGTAPATLALDILCHRLNHQIARASDVSDRLSAFADRVLGARPISGATMGEGPTECGMLGRINEMLDSFDRIIEATAETASALESV